LNKAGVEICDTLTCTVSVSYSLGFANGKGGVLIQDTIHVHNGKLIFVPKRSGAPIACQKDGPKDDKGRSGVKKNAYYLRIRDEIKKSKRALSHSNLSGYSAGRSPLTSTLTYMTSTSHIFGF
jgi:hypothetical protein